MGNFLRFFSDQLFISVLIRSLILAVITTLICIVIGYPTAYIIAKLKPNSQSLMVLLITAPTLINMLVRTYAWHGILLSTNFSSVIKVYIGMVYNFLPYMILQIYTSLSKMDQNLLVAAADLGCDPKTAFLKVTLPMSLGSYVLIGNLIESYFVSTGDWNFGSAISLVMCVVILVTMYFTKKLDYGKDE